MPLTFIPRHNKLFHWVFHPNTCTLVALLGPCFKTGELKPFRQHLSVTKSHPSPQRCTPNAHRALPLQQCTATDTLHHKRTLRTRCRPHECRPTPWCMTNTPQPLFRLRHRQAVNSPLQRSRHPCTYLPDALVPEKKFMLTGAKKPAKVHPGRFNPSKGTRRIPRGFNARHPATIHALD